MTRNFEWIKPASLTRLLVISYFIAVSLGLIEGTRILEFMLPILPETLATPLMRGLVLTLAVLILTGIARRPAALVLSLVVFFSSYSALYAGGDISAFWRDLALVGALLMTANFGATRDVAEQRTAPTKPVTAKEPETPADPASRRPRDSQPFRDDFDIVRSG